MLRNTVIASSGARHGRMLPAVLNFLEMEAAHRRSTFATPHNVQAAMSCVVTKEPSLLMVPGAAAALPPMALAFALRQQQYAQLQRAAALGQGALEVRRWC
uniref:Uncharacterized protein n=1 Tax=Arundo donax TaxID=35708 RepID=A0A0A9GZ89_ARUDO